MVDEKYPYRSVNYSNYLNRDFKSEAPERRRRLHRRHLHWLAAVSLSLGAFSLFGRNDAAEAKRDETLALPLQESLALPPLATRESALDPATPLTSAAEPKSGHEWIDETVRSGDTLSGILARHGVGADQVYKLMKGEGPIELLSELRPGQHLKLAVEEKSLQALSVSLAPHRNLLVELGQENFRASIEETPLEVRRNFASAEISSSLYLAGHEAGLSDNLIMELVGVFGWDIDFALDIRSGDRFTLLYEEQYLNGEKLRDGAILAAEFVNNGKYYRAVRFTDENGNSQYYTPEGHSMRKAFLRSPVDFRRISSTFQRERYHPVLGKKRPHRGVDYAASTGTPIKAAGDGKVIFRGTKGGYGHTVILQHGSRYTTLYAHLSKFRRGVGNGTRVKQGQIIGYVGKSGLATGPHLHYEFRIDGVHRNPLTVKLPDAAPIDGKLLAAFQQQTAPLLAQLEMVKATQLASAE